MITVAQGAQAISADKDEMMTTVLGSCIATCLFDPAARVGGMNHFLLPEPGPHASRRIVYGTQAMELLINGMLKLGSRKHNMQAKIFGGARVMEGLSDIGAANIDFVVQFLVDEDIPCVARSLGGLQARRVRFWPASGRANQKMFAPTRPIEMTRSAPVKAAPDVTMF